MIYEATEVDVMIQGCGKNDTKCKEKLESWENTALKRLVIETEG